MRINVELRRGRARLEPFEPTNLTCSPFAGDVLTLAMRSPCLPEDAIAGMKRIVSDTVA